jgi:hypothetical protein
MGSLIPPFCRPERTGATEPEAPFGEPAASCSLKVRLAYALNPGGGIDPGGFRRIDSVEATPSVGSVRWSILLRDGSGPVLPALAFRAKGSSVVRAEDDSIRGNAVTPRPAGRVIKMSPKRSPAASRPSTQSDAEGRLRRAIALA